MYSIGPRARTVPRRFFAGWVLFGCLWGCSRKTEEPSDQAASPGAPSSVQMLLPAAYTDTTLEFPHLRFTDQTLSLNDRCPVRKAKLNERLAPLFVNGRPIGFC
jgi:hypothetical protein